MYSRHEGFFKGHDGLNLFFQVWAKANSRGTILITHGQGEHSECYHRVVEFFKQSEWSFFAWDLRGHGRSEGKRGYSSEFGNYTKDFRIFLDLALSDSRVTGKPVVLLSHSMGGLIQLQTLGHKDYPVKAQVCSAPFLGLAFTPPAWKEAGARLLNRVFPEITLWNEIKHDQLTRDSNVFREYEEDVLRHNKISPGVFLGFEPASKDVIENASSIRLPTLFQIPEMDPVVNSSVAKQCFELLGSKNKELRVYGDGSKHELYNDTNREIVLSDMKKFVDRFLEAR